MHKENCHGPILTGPRNPISAAVRGPPTWEFVAQRGTARGDLAQAVDSRRTAGMPAREAGPVPDVRSVSADVTKRA
ncbi:hypothetical protein GCM10010289_16820 [Streptomyces violascens]|uniref:Uncharacterized protein n=1 Tax=Streptomyces violascens TaxID=67381 RepID=A0ABQ3QJ18_9ACTN|nr:hypothetical protein GCM10010289_16820 [Streptomyces violascens]GHI37270.1 hypothetical protein Sviol_16780 [Streptomyces violascens]